MKQALLPLLLLAQTVQAAVTLTSSANPSTLGQALTLTAAVSTTGATGSVTFYDGAAILGTQPLTAGTATLTTTLLPTGTRSLKAFYNGATAPLTQRVKSVPSNGFQLPITFPPQAFNGAIATGDFNRDGKPDLAIADGALSIQLGNGDGTFQPPVTFPAGANPLNVAVGDFNGDGKADLAVTNYSATFGGNVSILLGKGDGTFQPPVNYLTTYSAVFIAVADFNADGIADLVVASTGTGTGGSFNILFGNGDGTFQPAVISFRPCRPLPPICPSPAQTVVGDFNGDGKADLAVADGYSLSVLLGKGDGTFQSDVDYGIQAAPVNLIAADLNADGVTDLAFLSSNAAVLYVLIGKGDGTFASPVSYPYDGGQFFTAADLDGDGNLDLLIGAGAVHVLRGNGDATFQPFVNYPISPNYFIAAVPGAFSGDGRIGLAGIAQAGIAVLLGTAATPSTTTLTSAPNPTLYGDTVTLTAAVTPAAATGRVVFMDGTTVLGTQPLTAGIAVLKTNTLLAGSHAVTATYSGDSTFAVSTSSTLMQTVNLTPETLTLSSSPNPSTYGTRLTLTAALTLPGGLPATGTVTFHDGATTIGTTNLRDAAASISNVLLPVGTYALTATYSGDANHAPATSNSLTQVVIQGTVTTPTLTLTTFSNPSLLGQSVGLGVTITPSTATGIVTYYDGVTPLGTGPVANGRGARTVNSLPSGTHSLRAIYAGSPDFTVATSPAVSQTVTTLPLNGFKTVSTPFPGINPQASAVADLNQDGTPDLVIADKASGSVLVLLGNSDGTFQPATKLSTGGAPNAVVASDLNGDGRIDIAATNGVDVSVLPGNGNGTFGPAVHYASGAFQGLVVADFNGDGHPDLAVLQPAGVTILLNQGFGTFPSQQTYAIAGGATALAVADLNNDGNPDLVVVNVITPITTPRSNSTSYLTSLLGNADGTFQVLEPTLTPAYTYALVIADFNGDGIPDLALGTQVGTKVMFGEVITLFGQGDGTFRPGASVSVPGAGVPSLVSGDFNGDGVTDLAASTLIGSIFLLAGKSDGSFALGTEYPSASSGPTVIADWNRDGRPDIATVRPDGVDVLLGGTTPNPTATAMVNAASYQPSLAPGSLAALFGTFPIDTPNPDGVSVQFFINGPKALVLSATSSQINLQIPQLADFPSASIQNGKVYATFNVSVNGQISLTQSLQLTAFTPGAPGIFTTNSQGTGQGAILDANNRLVGPTNPTTAGATIQIYCTGLGPVDTTSTPNKTRYTPIVTIGGAPATVVFSGLTPGAVGLYQINAVVPVASSKGSTVPVVIDEPRTPQP